MDRQTETVYRRRAEEWIGRRGPQPLASRRIAQVVRGLPRGARVAELGCGPGWYAQRLRRRGLCTLALDLSPGMLTVARERDAADLYVRGDLAALPVRRGALDAAIAINTYQHLPFRELPLALAHLHHALADGAPIALTLAHLDFLSPSPREATRGWAQRRHADDPYGRRLFTFVSHERAAHLFESAGFEDVRIDPDPRGFWTWIRARRARSLPDFVAPGLDLLVCGLNPSPASADFGIPFGRPGNRFWPAAKRAHLVDRERDPFAAVERGLGFTDLVKRTTRNASQLDPREYAEGIERVRDTVRLHRPRVLCFVGLDGWRRVVDRQAKPGWIPGRFAGRKAYLMPSTSGLNAHDDVASLARHLRRASRG